MPIAFGGVDWRLVVLVCFLLGAGALQVVAAVGTSDSDVKLVVIGTASIVMFLSIGVVAWLIRGGMRREEDR